MAHNIEIGADFVEVIHAGPVAYRDRLAALDAVSGDKSVGNDLPLLINFTAARLVTELNHADYIARAVTHPFFGTRRVAIIGLSTEQGRTAWTAAIIRKSPFKLFSERADAVNWLTLGHS